MFLNRKVYKFKYHKFIMPIKYYKNDLMYQLKPLFFKKIFEHLSSKFKTQRGASKILQIPYITFRYYKNGKILSIPKGLIKKIIRTGVISEIDIKNNLLANYTRKELNEKSLNNGREIRKNQLKKWRAEIPKISKILSESFLDFEKWFLAYKKLIDFGVRKFNYVKLKKDFIEISYKTHSNKSKKEFVVRLPRKIYLDKEFLYFFGLWVGDKAGGGRFGIMNKEQKLVNFTKHYLVRLFQSPEVVLYIGKNSELPNNEKFNKIVRINHKKRGYAFSTHAINGVLVSFFDYLESNLNEFLNTIKEPNIFFSGLFDAEGNVSLEDSCFRWSCENKFLIPIFKEHLERLSLFKRYDGANFVSYNKEAFSNLILPYIIHPKKINNSHIVCFGKGILEKRFIEILRLIKEKPGITNKELSKLLKRRKSYAQVKVLEKLGYIYSKNYPKQLFINKQNIVNLQ